MAFKMRGNPFKQKQASGACTPPPEGCPEGQEWNSVDCGCVEKEKDTSGKRLVQAAKYGMGTHTESKKSYE
tara:strand:- start:811 stop:1023 length:213 start_codon:yes stop_codon:yes gene_type:complete